LLYFSRLVFPLTAEDFVKNKKTNDIGGPFVLVANELKHIIWALFMKIER